jgi:hypothetical protein
MRLSATVLIIGLLVLTWGCPPEDYPNIVNPTLRDINLIRNDTDLNAQEKRAELEALGIDPFTINAILRTERTANQFGGDLRTAYDKVVGGRMNELTPDEVQIYGDSASALDTQDTLDVSITDDGAQAIVSFFQQERITTRDELTVYLNNADNTVPSNVPENVLKPLFVDFDPQRLLPKLP